MALFTDSPTIGIQDLADHETEVLDMAGSEGINLTVKILLAREELGLELLGSFQRMGLSGVQLKNVVFTAPLRLWHIFRTLEIVYRDAYFSQLNDRYKAKWAEYKELGKWAADLLYQIGIGTVVGPIPEAHTPELSLVPGTMAPGRYFVKISWKNTNGEEGSPSQLSSIDVLAGNVARVKATHRPPNGVSWNVYVGVKPEELFLQNNGPIDPASYWIAPSSGLQTEQPPGNGQEPTFLSNSPRILLRG